MFLLAMYVCGALMFAFADLILRLIAMHLKVDYIRVIDSLGIIFTWPLLLASIVYSAVKSLSDD